MTNTCKVTKPKRIAIVANTTWNIYNFRLNIIRMLQDEGHEVIVMAPVDKYISYQEQFRDVVHVPVRKLRRDSVNPITDIQLTLELVDLYRQYKPDVVIHYTVKPNIYGGIAAKIAGVPSIAVVTGLGYAFIHNGIVKRTTKQLYKLSSKYHQKIVFENQDDRDLFISLNLIDPQKGLSVKGCGVDTASYIPEESKLHKEPGEILFTFVGRMLYDKGVREFTSAAKKVREKYPKAKFWIIGELDNENPSSIKESDLVQWVRDDGIKYLGAKDNVRPFLRDSDCIVLPSYREGMPRVIMEAMSMARPVITTDTAGCREAVDDGLNGFLVPVGDDQKLAEAMFAVIGMTDEERKRMGVLGREKAIEQFDENIVSGFFHGLIDSILNGSNPN